MLPKWRIIDSAVGDISLLPALLDLAEVAIEKIGLPIVNGFLAKGMPLPTSSHLKLKNTELAEKNGYLLVGSDFDIDL